LARCDIYVALSPGIALNIRFTLKHLADMKRIYAEVSQRIDSFKKA